MGTPHKDQWEQYVSERNGTPAPASKRTKTDSTPSSKSTSSKSTSSTKAPAAAALPSPTVATPSKLFTDALLITLENDKVTLIVGRYKVPLEDLFNQLGPKLTLQLLPQKTLDFLTSTSGQQLVAARLSEFNTKPSPTKPSVNPSLPATPASPGLTPGSTKNRSKLTPAQKSVIAARETVALADATAGKSPFPTMDPKATAQLNGDTKVGLSTWPEGDRLKTQSTLKDLRAEVSNEINSVRLREKGMDPKEEAATIASYIDVLIQRSRVEGKYFSISYIINWYMIAFASEYRYPATVIPEFQAMITKYEGLHATKKHKSKPRLPIRDYVG